MRGISLKPLREFWQRHPDAKASLRLWYKTAVAAEWSDLQELRRTYPHADAVRAASGDTLTVFHVGGNKYRLIARIRYDYRLINVRAVLTHEAYGRGAWKE
ncbi:MAG TPA: type II toxin-antitoxin system HigB family toxin [Phycisphaerae bacterium]|nr:type II toxin-antitoxin system HigB family toxin [Phycisphaerae bacterium]